MAGGQFQRFSAPSATPRMNEALVGPSVRPKKPISQGLRNKSPALLRRNARPTPLPRVSGAVAWWRPMSGLRCVGRAPDLRSSPALEPSSARQLVQDRGAMGMRDLIGKSVDEV